jgi:hypothetical protein
MTTQCEHQNLHPLLRSSPPSPGVWTYCNDCGARVEVTQGMEDRWLAFYEDCVARGVPYQGVFGVNDPDGTMGPMA